MAHPPLPELLGKLVEARAQVPMGMYENHKGDTYQVIGYCILEMTDEAAIEYVGEDSPQIKWVKSLLEWHKPVVQDGNELPRFILLH